MSLISALRTSDMVTENGMVTNSTSLNSCVDFFFQAGAMRAATEVAIISSFSAAFVEDKLRALKILFWARDIRGGAGERRLFRVCLEHLAKYHSDYLVANLDLISEYGRWDDHLILLWIDNPVLNKKVSSLILKSIQEDKNALAAKWMPRKGKIANILRKSWGMTPKEYRKVLVEATRVIESDMCTKQWGKINYSHVPSVAAARYTNAFTKNDGNRYREYIIALQNPVAYEANVKVNASAVYPYDIVKTLRKGVQELAVEQWKALPNYLEGNTKRILPVVDVSGSMQSAVSQGGTTTCMDVAIALGLYISEKNEGPFKDAFITFSESPSLQYLQGNLVERFNQLESSNWGMSTDLEAVFKLILDKAVGSKLQESEMPNQILILSDMQFNQAIDDHNFSAMDMIKSEYQKHGYELPEIIFWNLQSRGRDIPVRFDEAGTALISGFSPAIMTSILNGSGITPVMIMDETLNKQRYSKISLPQIETFENN